MDVRFGSNVHTKIVVAPRDEATRKMETCFRPRLGPSSPPVAPPPTLYVRNRILIVPKKGPQGHMGGCQE